jgi:hypothetical protein
MEKYNSIKFRSIIYVAITETAQWKYYWHNVDTIALQKRKVYRQLSKGHFRK